MKISLEKLNKIHLYSDLIPDDKELIPLKELLPSKKPFIILDIPKVDARFFQTVASNKIAHPDEGRIYLIFTGRGKIVTLVEKIFTMLSKKDLDEEEQTFLDLLQSKINEFKRQLIKQTPLKSKPLEKYSRVEESDFFITDPRLETPRIELLSYHSKLHIFKKFPTGRSIAEIEAFNGYCYQLLLNRQTPKVRSVHDQGVRKGAISEAIHKFQSLRDYSYSHLGKLPSQEKLIKAGIGKILAAAYCEEENDLHLGNIGYDEINEICYKIDNDQTTWPFTCHYLGFPADTPLPEFGYECRATGIKPIDAFPITQHDLNSFPHFKDAKPKNFVGLDGDMLDLFGIENDEKFMDDVYKTFLKKAITGEEEYRKIAEISIGNVALRERLIKHKTNRSALLKKELLHNEKFIAWFMKNPEILQREIMEEFGDYDGGIKKYLNLDKMENELTRFNEEILLERMINSVLEKSIDLHKKLGVLGGEKRNFLDRRVKIPFSASLIFDLCIKHKNEKLDPRKTLESIVEIAQKANSDKSHTFLNRRQKETTQFYREITSLDLGLVKAKRDTLALEL